MKAIACGVTAALRDLLTSRTTPACTCTSRIDALDAHLEAALEGLQDAVYRQDVVRDTQIADLRHSASRAHRQVPQ